MKKRVRSLTAVLLAFIMATLMIGTTTVNAAYVERESVGLESTGNSTFDAFINDSRWTEGVSWWGDYTGGKGPEISPWDSSGCGAYAGDFVKYCFNVDNPRYGGEAFYDVNEVRAGDVIHIGYNDNGHWFVILKRSGNNLYTAEGNYGGVVRIGWNYSISGSKFAEDSRHFDVGYHFQNGSTEISYSVNLNDGEAISGNSFPITGTVTYGGKYPWLHLYVDYGWVADTANNSEGNYAFYLDTTKYSDGEHLIGIKITNEDGLDFTTWRKVYIDNSKPNISNIYLSQVSDSSFRVCVVANDNIAIDHVRVATWTKSDQSDLIWHDCYYNGSETYFIDLRRSDYAQGATQYYNHAYVYDNADNYDVKVVTMTFEDSYSLVSAIYYSQIGRDSFRICCQVRDNDDISKVRVATWATGDMSDIKWQDCYYNGYGTYFMDLQRSDYLNGAKRYISHLYVYDKNGGCESFEKSIVYDDTPPIISDITISEKTSKGFRISCRIEDDSSIKSVQFPTWRSDNNQNDLIWYNAEMVDNVATCYIPISNHNNAYGTYYIHIYAYDYFDNLGTGRAAVTINPPFIGDTNLDGNIDIRDVTAIQRHLTELEPFNEEQLAVADTDGNGEINISDATHLQMYLAEYDTQLG